MKTKPTITALWLLLFLPAIVFGPRGHAATYTVINTDDSTIRCLVIRTWGGDGIEIQSGSNNNTIAGNYIGQLNTSGTDAGSETK